MKKIILILAIMLISVVAFAETVTLKSGRVIEGDILERTDDYIKIDFKGVSLTFYNDEIESVDGKVVEIEDEAEHVAEAKDGGGIVYKEILEAALMLGRGEQKQEGETFKEFAIRIKNNLEEILHKFDNFIQNFRESVFINDAKFLSIYLRRGMSGEENSVAEDVKRFLLEHPDWKMEKLTLEVLKNLPITVVPSEYILTYVEAQVELFRNPEIATKNFSFLKDNLDFSNDNSDMLAHDIYSGLYFSYFISKQTEMSDRILKEAVEKFPENQKFKDMMQKEIEIRNLPEDYFRKP